MYIALKENYTVKNLQYAVMSMNPIIPKSCKLPDQIITTFPPALEHSGRDKAHSGLSSPSVKQHR